MDGSGCAMVPSYAGKEALGLRKAHGESGDGEVSTTLSLRTNKEFYLSKTQPVLLHPSLSTPPTIPLSTRAHH